MNPINKQTCQARLETLLARYLPPDDGSTLIKAMHYACLNGGKRLRPYLAYQSAALFNTPLEIIDPIAVAIEFIHCYSLIHDDLPAMDNDELRRGKPTCHKAFDEATAILAGDALLTLAFEVLAQAPIRENYLNNLKIIHNLAQAAGPTGMVKGQALDLAAQGKQLSYEQLCQMHRAKTGALIAASVQCGAIAGDASKTDLEELHKFGLAIGLAFQIKDDILDALGKSETMGKTPGQDVKNQKCTFVTLLGLHHAEQSLAECYTQSLAHLASFGQKAEALRSLSAYIVGREI
ncbi:polyprenyl synthetase family protein [Candidatus Berkiella aquae]|uniref:Farnesyl diphosphate synthase n=1 Tax=Candidatus Berkiella aquae TaxID=295108 RepID=A0A0Q9YYD1_9GAMM|nr:farnesyl diphosphate synthase [Candidatus Berkiella aquae]MCS5710345.1 polyprenyl synthetase family protein [Candidatus Berkiella aquae]